MNKNKELVWVIIGQIFGVLGSLFLVRILTENLTTNEYGELALAITFIGLVNQIITGGVINGIARFYPIAYEYGDIAGFFSGAKKLFIYITITILIIWTIGVFVLIYIGNKDLISLASVLIVYTILSTLNSALNGIQNAARQRKIVALHTSFESWLKLIIILFLLLWVKLSSIHIISIYIISSTVMAIAQLYVLQKLIRSNDHIENNEMKKNWVKEIINFSWPFSAWGIFTWFQQSSDRWALQAYESASKVGEYAVLYQLGYAPIGLAAVMALNYLSPILYQEVGDSKSHIRNQIVTRKIWIITKTSLAFTIIIGLISFLFHNEIFSLLVAHEYRSISYLLPWVMIASGIFSSGQMIAMKIISDIKPNKIIAAKVITALIGGVLNIYAAKYHGVDGVVYSLLIFSVLYYFSIVYVIKSNEYTSG